MIPRRGITPYGGDEGYYQLQVDSLTILEILAFSRESSAA